MSVRVHCPHCNHKMVVADESEGKKLRCKPCGAIFVVRNGTAIKAGSQPSRSRSARRNPLAPPRRRPRDMDSDHDAGGETNAWVLPVAIGGGAVLLVVLCLAAVAGFILLMPGQPVGPGMANVTQSPQAQPQPPERPKDTGVKPDPQPPQQTKPQPAPADSPKGTNPGPVPQPQQPAAQKPSAPAPAPAPPKPADPPKPSEPAKPREPGKFEPKVPWGVKPDPSTFQSPGKWDLKTELPAAFMGAVVFPYLDSPFVGLSSTDPKFKDHVQVYDLRTMKPVGVPIKGGFGAFFALSPDGKYVASSGSGNIDVFSLENGKLLYTFAKGVNNVNLGVMEFAGNDLFLTETHDGASSDLRVWDLKTGKEVAKIASPVEYFHWKWSGISPGGKYLVMQQTTGNGYTLHFWELATGKLVGQQELQPQKDKWGQAQGIAFTPDGKFMSLIWRLNDAECWSKLWTWDVATGKKLSEHKIPKIDQIDLLCWHGTSRDLQWLADGSGWMVTSHFVLERETGKEVGRLGPVPSNIGGPTRKLLDANHMAIVGGPNQFKPSFRIEAIPRADLDAAMKKAREEKKP